MAQKPASDNRLKQRLVGAVVLVSLAVIFIPMILGGKGGFDRLITSSNIPPKPEEGRRVVEIPLRELPPRPEKKPVTTVVVDEYTKKLPENFVPAEPGKDQKVETDSRSPEKNTPPLRRKPADKPSVAEKKPDNATKRAGADQVGAWVVQMGSFSERANAMVLRDRIRKKKYPAYVEAVATNRGTIYRVRVGPERSRAKAEALQAKLRKVFNLNGMVFPHKDKK
ncbi:MAG TPA: hypothetical protein ENJ24_03560 [Gammaproteobacteria bacterium]|nr:hypothetical protein [Gammaproteobacteria bacterium]